MKNHADHQTKPKPCHTFVHSLIPVNGIHITDHHILHSRKASFRFNGDLIIRLEIHRVTQIGDLMV